MKKRIHIIIFMTTYIIGIGSMIYLVGKLINDFFNVTFGSYIVLGIQLATFYSLMKVEEYFKQEAVDEYIAKQELMERIEKGDFR